MFPLDCFFRRQLSPEHVTWSTAKVMSCFQLERRAEGLTLSQADWRRINVGLTTTWSDSHGQICVAAVLNAQLFCFLSSSMQSAVVCARKEEEDGLRRLPAAGATGGLPPQSMPSLSTEAGSCCRVEVYWSDWSSGRDLGPEPQDELQRAKVEKPGRFTVSFRATLWTVFQAFKNLPPLLQIYTQWTVLLQPLAFLPLMLTGVSRFLPHICPTWAAHLHLLQTVHRPPPKNGKVITMLAFQTGPRAS